MPQRVRLPNEQSFLARYERVSRRNLPRNVTITRTRQIGPRNWWRQKQKGGSIFGNIARLGAKGIDHAPELYRLGTSKIKNQSVKTALESDAANYIVEEAQKKQFKSCLVKMTQGISNFQIEKAFENIINININDKFVGLFPASDMNRFINYKSMISEKRENIPLWLQTLPALTGATHTGGVF